MDGKSELVVINVYCPRADPEDNERETFKMKFYKLLELRCLALNRYRKPPDKLLFFFKQKELGLIYFDMNFFET